MRPSRAAIFVIISITNIYTATLNEQINHGAPELAYMVLNIIKNWSFINYQKQCTENWKSHHTYTESQTDRFHSWQIASCIESLDQVALIV